MCGFTRKTDTSGRPGGALPVPRSASSYMPRHTSVTAAACFTSCAATAGASSSAASEASSCSAQRAGSASRAAATSSATAAAAAASSAVASGSAAAWAAAWRRRKPRCGGTPISFQCASSGSFVAVHWSGSAARFSAPARAPR